MEDESNNIPSLFSILYAEHQMPIVCVITLADDEIIFRDYFGEHQTICRQSRYLMVFFKMIPGCSWSCCPSGQSDPICSRVYLAENVEASG